MSKPVCLVIMDGLAYGAPTSDRSTDAVDAADTPVLDALWSRWPHSRLKASGREVGLPAGQMGNSEVGHLNIGAGRIVYQDLTRIDVAIEDGSFFDNETLVHAMRTAATTGGTLHLMGLLSDGGIHSSNRHLYALLRLAVKAGVADVAVHCFLDGRDTPPTSAGGYLAQLEQQCANIGVGRIATIMGRYYAMDRDQRWDRVQRAYDALTLGVGAHYRSVNEAINASYQISITDEFVKPTIIEGGFSPIKDGDSVIFFNFRPDRAREITHGLVDSSFQGFARMAHPKIHFVCMTPYDDTIDTPIAYPKETLDQVLAQVLADRGLRQLHIAETEKYAHVTFFLNGGQETPYPGEQRILIPSPKVATYDLQPEMSAIQVTDALVEAIADEVADVYLCNFANGDMVGHTGVFEATRQAVEVVDAQIGRIIDAMTALEGVVLITADHGNAEQMLDQDGSTPFTAHTCNSVPFIAVNTPARRVHNGALCDLAPTVLALLKIPAPKVWTGTNLLVY